MTICRTCRQWCASDERQWHNRQELMLSGDGNPHRCPDCGSSEWATTKEFIVQRNPAFRFAITASVLLVSVALMLAIFVAVIAIFVSPARSELCLNRVDHGIERKAGYRWQWRTVDGKQCWYYSNRLLPREDLIWSYTTEEFDVDVDKILGRKFYTREELDR